MTRPPILLATVLAACALQSTPARAEIFGNAVDFCQGSLSNLENGLRKRPLAIANEGVDTKFISCSVQNAQVPGQQVNAVQFLATNRNNTPQSISCTLVDGVALPFPGYPPIYLPKTFVIAPNNYVVGGWDKATDNGNTAFRVVNLNCALPSGIELNSIDVLTGAVGP